MCSSLTLVTAQQEGIDMTTLDLRPAPQAAPAAARVRNHALTEVRLVMRNGEQLLLALVIPIGIIVAGRFLLGLGALPALGA